MRMFEGLPREGDRVRSKDCPKLVGVLEEYELEEGRLMAWVKWDNDPNGEYNDHMNPYKLEIVQE